MTKVQIHGTLKDCEAEYELGSFPSDGRQGVRHEGRFVEVYTKGFPPGLNVLFFTENDYKPLE